MEYLIKLVCPPGGVVLDPFAGSGSTAEAALTLGFDFILCEKEAEYIEDIKHRLQVKLSNKDVIVIGDDVNA
jgi:site-specific DNA-methyltransferase (adenine-specific)